MKFYKNLAEKHKSEILKKQEEARKQKEKQAKLARLCVTHSSNHSKEIVSCQDYQAWLNLYKQKNVEIVSKFIEVTNELKVLVTDQALREEAER